MSNYSHNSQERPRGAVQTTGISRLWKVEVFNVAVAALSLAMFVAYVALNTTAATQGFTIKSMERRITDLRDEQKKIDLQTASARSMDNVQARVNGLGLVPVTNVTYVDAAPNTVAVR